MGHCSSCVMLQVHRLNPIRLKIVFEVFNRLSILKIPQRECFDSAKPASLKSVEDGFGKITSGKVKSEVGKTEAVVL